jgi:hypothetical protein
MPLSFIDASDPWYLGSSDYEEARYRLELSVLSNLHWTSLVEIGACVGAFTLRLIELFPGRQITACEPYEPFVNALRIRLGQRARVIHRGADETVPQADVIFASSCLYYARPFPIKLLRIRAKYYVFSHCHRYQKGVIEPCMTALNYELLSEEELPARVEAAYDLADVKDGTVVQVWRGEPSSP